MVSNACGLQRPVSSDGCNNWVAFAFVCVSYPPEGQGGQLYFLIISQAFKSFKELQPAKPHAVCASASRNPGKLFDLWEFFLDPVILKS